MGVYVNAADLNRRVTIESKTVTRDSYGGQIEAWATLATVSAEIQPMTGREMMGSGLELDETPHKIRFRYGSTWSALNVRDHRLTFGGKTFDLVSVNNVEQRNVLFECVGVVRG